MAALLPSTRSSAAAAAAILGRGGAGHHRWLTVSAASNLDWRGGGGSGGGTTVSMNTTTVSRQINTNTDAGDGTSRSSGTGGNGRSTSRDSGGSPSSDGTTGCGGSGSGSGSGSTSTSSQSSATPHWARPGRASGVGVRVYYQNRQAQQHYQRRGKKTTRGSSATTTRGKNKRGAGFRSGSGPRTDEDEFGRRRENEPKLLRTFPAPSSTGGDGSARASSSKGSSSDEVAVPYRPFVFPGDAYRYPFHMSSGGDRNRDDSHHHHRASHQSQSSARTTTQTLPLPLLDVSPLLDPRSYCRKSARPGGTTTVSGGDAARRLAAGRRRAREIVQGGGLVSRNDASGGDDKSGKSDESRRGGGKRGSRRRRRARAFALSGTGIPQALLQDHIDFADGLLRSMDGAAEISFGNCMDGTLGFNNVLRVRSRTGENDPHPWPPLEEEDGLFSSSSSSSSLGDGGDIHQPYLGCEHRMQLYLTVMDRLARTFGKLLDPRCDEAANPASGLETPTTIETANDASIDDNDGERATTDDAGSNFDLRNWNAAFLRGYAFPPNLVPQSILGPGSATGASIRIGDSDSSRAGNASPPIIELSQGSSVACPTHVRISVQGTPSASRLGVSNRNRAVIRRKRVSPLTLVFDAKFSRGDGS